MKLSRNTTSAARPSFTLIELLIVISIISILVSLTVAAVMRALILGPRATARYEIGHLDQSVQTFESSGGYNLQYLPSRIWLRKYYGDYFVPNSNPPQFLTDLDGDSVAFLTNMFKSSGQKFLINWQANGIAWHTLWSNQGHFSELLEGDQCLVFFLGGIETNSSGLNGCLGFSTNAAAPDTLGGDRKSYYEFKSNRLFVRPGKTYFFSYQDAYGNRGVPYLYFSAYGKDNGYNRYAVDKLGNYWHVGTTGTVVVSDCSSSAVWPYAESSLPLVRYLKSKTDQIVSAGADGKFGPGTDVSGATLNPFFFNAGTASALTKSVGGDDQANFAPGMLQVGP